MKLYKFKEIITKQDMETITIGGQQVGLGTYLEGNTVWKQFHLELLIKILI